MERPLIAITVHKVPNKEFCGVVVLRRESDGSWNGRCSKCGEVFQVEQDPKFEARILAMRN
jgi:ribosomal protein L37AE/L43A